MAFRLLNSALLLKATCALLLPSPTGPYGVGVRQYLLNKTTPNDPTLPNASNGKFLLVSLYYPTAQKPQHTQKYFDPASAQIYENDWGFPNGSLQTLESELQPHAPFLQSEDECKRLPTLVFSPGAGDNAYMYYLTTANLVSKGYTLITIDHPGEAPALQLPHGETILGLPEDFDTENIAQQIYDYRVEDIKAVIADFPRYIHSQQECTNASFNTTHYVAFGHSIGGAASAGAAQSIDSVMGGLNYDGEYIEPVPDVGKPFLTMQSINHTDGYDATLPTFYQRQTAWYEAVSMYGGTHVDYKDVCSWAQLLGVPFSSFNPPYDTEACGPIGGRRAHEIIHEYTGRFMEFLMSGELGVLGTPSLKWREVVYLHGSFFPSDFAV